MIKFQNLLLIFLAIGFNLVISEVNVVPGQPIYPLSLELRDNSSSSDDNDCADNDWGVSCADCFNLKVCLGSNSQGDTKSCHDINPKTPYCDVNHCTATAPAGCENEIPPTSFICTQAGLFPNPKDCSKYFLCGGPGQPPREYECPLPFIYNSKQGGCTRRTFVNDCQVINCLQNPDRFIIYTPDKSILAYCKNGAEYPILTRCDDSANEEYDPNTLECKFTCRQEGRFPDSSSNCKKYYQCIRNGYNFVQVSVNCDPLWFDTIAGTCVIKKPADCQ